MHGILQSWLQRTATPEEFERERLERMAAAVHLPLDKVIAKFASRPFGEMTDQWREFVSQMQDSDELWFFTSPPDTFTVQMGCNGFAIVRDKNIHDVLVMMRT